jgi:hypothetical protein
MSAHSSNHWSSCSQIKGQSKGGLTQVAQSAAHTQNRRVGFSSRTCSNIRPKETALHPGSCYLRQYFVPRISLIGRMASDTTVASTIHYGREMRLQILRACLTHISQLVLRSPATEPNIATQPGCRGFHGSVGDQVPRYRYKMLITSGEEEVVQLERVPWSRIVKSPD